MKFDDVVESIIVILKNIHVFLFRDNLHTRRTGRFWKQVHLVMCTIFGMRRLLVSLRDNNYLCNII